MVATHEDALAERHSLAWIEWRRLVGLTVLDSVGAQMSPRFDHRAEHRLELGSSRVFEITRFEGSFSGNGSGNQMPTRWCVVRRDIAHHGDVQDGSLSGTVEDDQFRIRRNSRRIEVHACSGSRCHWLEAEKIAGNGAFCGDDDDPSVKRTSVTCRHRTW